MDWKQLIYVGALLVSGTLVLLLAHNSELAALLLGAAVGSAPGAKRVQP